MSYFKLYIIDELVYYAIKTSQIQARNQAIQAKILCPKLKQPENIRLKPIHLLLFISNYYEYYIKNNKIKEILKENLKNLTKN